MQMDSTKGQGLPVADDGTVDAQDLIAVTHHQHHSLPISIVVPHIKGEMQELRPATIDDMDAMETIGAFSAASAISGRSSQAEKSIVNAWVRDSMAWQRGAVDMESVFAANGYTRTMAWTSTIESPSAADSADDVDSVDGTNSANDAGNAKAKAPERRVIGMIFLHTIDARAHSAQVQVILGKDYRGRGYSRDAMPRVMTYGFAPAPTGLGLHRISVSVPEKNARTLSVYQFLGFTQEGLFRDALWDSENDKYQDRYLLATLADEYDPVRSLDAFGMRIIPDNPGVKEALAAHQHSVEIEQAVRSSATGSLPASGVDTPAPGTARPALSGAQQIPAHMDPVQAVAGGRSDDESHEQWPYSQSSANGEKTKTSKRAWWRRFGKSRKREPVKDAKADKKKGAAPKDDRSEGNRSEGNQASGAQTEAAPSSHASHVQPAQADSAQTVAKAVAPKDASKGNKKQ